MYANSQELFDAFREDVVDKVKPYLWTDAEVTRYANAAYRMFVRLTGGIYDMSSDATKISVVANEDLVDIHKSVLRVFDAVVASDMHPIRVINQTDLPNLMGDPDYHRIQPLSRQNLPGTIRYLLIGVEKHKAKVLQKPMVDDEIQLTIARLPFTHIVDGTHTLDDVDEDHHIYLLDWMKHLAYKKQDVETFDRSKSEESEATFTRYCAQVRAEWERYKHKNRTVTYGGL